MAPRHWFFLSSSGIWFVQGTGLIRNASDLPTRSPDWPLNSPSQSSPSDWFVATATRASLEEIPVSNHEVCLGASGTFLVTQIHPVIWFNICVTSRSCLDYPHGLFFMGSYALSSLLAGLGHPHINLTGYSRSLLVTSFWIINKGCVWLQGRISRGGHELPKILLGPAMPYPSTPCRRLHLKRP
jgi:hypothetical protein